MFGTPSAEARILVYEKRDVGPFVLNGFAELRSLWGGWGWCEPVYDANARCLRVYAASGNRAPVAQAGQLLVKLRRELSERTLDLVLQTGTIEATFGAGLQVQTLARPSSGTLRQVVLQANHVPLVKVDSLVTAAILRRMYAGKTVAPEPQFGVDVTGTVPADWSGAPCYVRFCLGHRGQQAVRHWAKQQAENLCIELVGPGKANDADKLGCLLPTSTQAREFADEYNKHRTQSSNVEFGFDDPASADLLVKHAGAEVTMYSQVDLGGVNATTDPLGAARLIADEAAKKFSVTSFTIDKPSKGVAVCRLFSGGGGGATQCSKAFVHATDKWQDHRLLANGRFPRLLLQTLLKTGRLQQLAKAAGVRVAEPEQGTELPPHLGVKGSDTGFGQLLYHLGVEQDALKQRAAMCSITPALAAELRRVGWVEEQQWYDAHVVVDDDNVFVAASSSGTRDQIVASLNLHRLSFGLSTTDQVTCVCGALSANRLTSCGHVVCDDCMVKTTPHCPYAGCKQLLYVDDLQCNGEQRKALAERLICAALDKGAAEHAFGVCPTATCAAIIPLRSKMSLCTKCAVSVCTACKVSDVRHKGRTCGAYARYLTAVAPCPRPDCDADDLPFQEGAQCCPKCSTSVCVACGLLDADWKGHHTSCKEYSKAQSCPMLRLYKEARQFASKHLTENGYSTFEFHENECVRNPGCGALDKFLLAARENNVTGVLEGRLGHFGWHGTKSTDAVSTICCGGWDPARRLVQLYGKGEYFAYRAGTSLGSYSGDTKMLIVAFILKGSWLNRTEHFVVNNPCDHRVSYVVPVGVVWFGGMGGFPKQICTRLQATSPLTALWEWGDVDGTWRPYADADCRTIEQADKGQKRTVQIQIVQRGTSVPMTYKIDFATMQQTNLSSGLGGVRSVRRTDRPSAVPTKAAASPAAAAPSNAVPKQTPTRQQQGLPQPLAAGQPILVAGAAAVPLRAAPPPAAAAPASSAAVAVPPKAAPKPIPTRQQTTLQGTQASQLLTALWEWKDVDGTWFQYTDADCRTIERADKGQKGTVQIQVSQRGTSVPMTYKIDFATMQQTNLSSGLGGVRSVRRMAVLPRPAASSAGQSMVTSSAAPSTALSSRAARASSAAPSIAAPSSTAPSTSAPSRASPPNTGPSTAELWTFPSFAVQTSAEPWTFPSSAAPSNDTPSDAALSTSAPSSAVPSSAAPSNAALSTSAPSNAAPSTALSSRAARASSAAPSIAAPSSTAPSTSAPSRASPPNTGPSTAELWTFPSFAVQTSAEPWTFPSSAAPSNDTPSDAALSTSAPSSAVPSIAAPSSTAPSTSVPSRAAPSIATPSDVAPSTSAPPPPSTGPSSAEQWTSPSIATSSGAAPSTSAPSSAASSSAVQSSAVSPLFAAPSIAVPTSAPPPSAGPSSAPPSAPSSAAPSISVPSSAAPFGAAPPSAVPSILALSGASPSAVPFSAAHFIAVGHRLTLRQRRARDSSKRAAAPAPSGAELRTFPFSAAPSSAAPSISVPSTAAPPGAAQSTFPASAAPSPAAAASSSEEALSAASLGAAQSILSPSAASSPAPAVPAPSAALLRAAQALLSSLAAPSPAASSSEAATSSRAAPSPSAAALPSSEEALSAASTLSPSAAPAPAPAVPASEEALSAASLRAAQSILSSHAALPSPAAAALPSGEEALSAASTLSPSAASAPAPAVPASEEALSAASLRAAQSILSSHAAPPSPAAAALPRRSEEALSAASLRAAQSSFVPRRAAARAVPSSAVPPSATPLRAAPLRAGLSICVVPRAVPSPMSAARPRHCAGAA